MFFPPTEHIDQSQQPPPLPPNKPPAFNMTVDPAEDTINAFISFCAGVGNPITRHNAIRYLKVKDNNVDAAFDAYFNGDDITAAEKATTWDEGAWSQGKDGPGAGGDNGMNDSHLRPLLSSAAPTRNNSPSGGPRSSLHPSSKQQEDEDLAQAMAISQGNDYFQPQQESGVVSSGGQERQQFGPANRTDYNPNQWAMVHAGPSTSGEIVPDAEAGERVGKPGEPKMLKPLPGSGEYLANLLTILANVYGAREAMLTRERVKADYGADGEWWKGHPISMPKIVALGDPSSAGADGETDQYDDLLAEVQRLMAFLSVSGSERSYGSAGALTQTEAIKSANTRHVRSNTTMELFLEQWAVAAVSKTGDDDLASMFNTTVGTNASEGMAATDMNLIDMFVDSSAGEKSQELPELLDGLLWDTSDPNVSSDNFIERPAEILVIRLRQRNLSNNDGKLKVVVPPEFHVDKYLREHIESTRATRAEMAKGKKKVGKIEQVERKLRMWRNPKDGKEVDASKLVEHTRKYYQEENKRSAEGDEPPQYQEISDKLAAVSASIDTKLKTLAEEKEKTLAAIASMSRAPPPGLTKDDLQHQYILRGVATKPNITYVLAHENDDLEGEEAFDDADDNTYPGMRWWRLEYEPTPSGLSAKVTKNRVGDYDVLRAVELEHDKALLVYGNMHVNETPPPEEQEPLPSPLQEFVKRDNELFAAELELERAKPPAYQQSFDLTGTNDADSGIGARGGGGRTSMDSTRVEGGSPPPSPPDYDQDAGGFERHPSFGLGPEMKGTRYGGGGGYDGVDDGEVAEIRLEGEGEGEEDVGVEMVERAYEPLMGRVEKGGGGDVEMGEGK